MLLRVSSSFSLWYRAAGQLPVQSVAAHEASNEVGVLCLRAISALWTQTCS